MVPQPSNENREHVTFSLVLTQSQRDALSDISRDLSEGQDEVRPADIARDGINQIIEQYESGGKDAVNPRERGSLEYQIHIENAEEVNADGT